jgi:hypothetical protein
VGNRRQTFTNGHLTVTITSRARKQEATIQIDDKVYDVDYGGMRSKDGGHHMYMTTDGHYFVVKDGCGTLVRLGGEEIVLSQI